MAHLITTQRRNNAPLLHINAYSEKVNYSLAGIQCLAYMKRESDSLALTSLTGVFV